MATYYAIGVVNKFQAKAKHAIDPSVLEEVVGERLDLSLFELSRLDDALEGTLKSGLFEKHIEDFVDKLAKIDPISDSTIRFYFENYGTNIDQYDSKCVQMRISGPDRQLVDVRAEMALVLIEGKVIAECFIVEPVLVNWLFRHCDFGNPLARIVMSGIIG